MPIKKENVDVELLWAKVDDRVIELDSDDELSAASNAVRWRYHSLRWRRSRRDHKFRRWVTQTFTNPSKIDACTQALYIFFISDLSMNIINDPMEISDTEDLDSVFKHGTKMSGGVVVLSDMEDPEEIIIFDDGSIPYSRNSANLVPVRGESARYKFWIWT